MGLEKFEILEAGMTTHASELDKVRQATSQRVEQLVGKSAAYKNGSQKILAICALVQKELAEGNLDELPKDSVELAKLLKKWLGRCYGAMENLSDTAVVEGSEARGRLQGLDYAIGMAKKSAQQSKKSAEARRATEGSDNVVPIRPGSRKTGEHPGPTLKERRLTEAKDAPESPPTNGGGKPRARTRKGSTGAQGSKRPGTRKRVKKDKPGAKV